MGRWVSPAEQQRREMVRLVAETRPAAKAAIAEVASGWAEVLPQDWSTLVSTAIRAVVQAALPQATPAVSYQLATTLYNELETPFRTRERQERLAAERAAEALVDTNRPVVATIRADQRIGDLMIVRGDATKDDQVLVVIAHQYVRANYEANEDGGTYCDLAEPNESERATDAYQALAKRARRANAGKRAASSNIDVRRDEALAAIRAEGREPSLFEDLFAGASDD